MTEYVEQIVNIRDIKKWKSRGYEVVPGQGADGSSAQGDSIVMRTSKENAAKRRKNMRAGFESAKKAVDAGENPLGVPNSPHAEFIFSRSKNEDMVVVGGNDGDSDN